MLLFWIIFWIVIVLVGFGFYFWETKDDTSTYDSGQKWVKGPKKYGN